MIRQVSARAPSNIALIKYMGKREGARNLPENPSLSLTLDGLCTFVEARAMEGTARGERAAWIGELPAGAPEGARVPALAQAGAARFVEHFERTWGSMPALFSRYGLALADRPARVELRAANTFPAASGIASSASSFAALTLATAGLAARDSEAWKKAWVSESGLREGLAALSREGSGSSCRSFDGPWVAWESDTGRAIPAALSSMAHFVLLVSSAEKAISSSEAHARVKSSPLWPDRPARATERYGELSEALEAGDLARVARLAWVEAWEMHSLFHTAVEPFTYWEASTISALKVFASQVTRENPPIITLDAGPNIHLICPERERERWRVFLRSRLPSIPFLEDHQGAGAALL